MSIDLIRLDGAEYTIAEQHILDDAATVIKSGERVCIVGRNGTGKSTLLRIMTGEIRLDDGTIQRKKDLRVARLEQDPPRGLDKTVFDFVAEGVEHITELLTQYQHLTEKLTDQADDKILSEMTRLQHALDEQNGWHFHHKIVQVLEKFALEPGASMASLSGGWLRKAALAKALVSEPELLLLDEPTNHLDISMVKWLEQEVKNFNGAVVFISHDRAFIRAVASRILDLDRGRLVSYPGNYDEYLLKKAEDLKVEQAHWDAFDKKLAEEETWIRQGIKARRTRNEGRVRALKAMRQERQARVTLQGNFKASVEEASRSGKLVFELDHVSFGYPNNMIGKDLSMVIKREDRIALVGPNGVGKSSFIKLLLGDLKAQAGKLKVGTNLEVAYFDQHRLALDPDMSVQDAVADGKQDIIINGHKRHVLGYLGDFLFSPKRARAPVRSLSGGEKNRLLLAKLLLKPSNLLVLDEPTNDLDVESLELLESILLDYKGTVILVSHDREFITNTASSCLAFLGEGEVSEVVGGYEEVARYIASRQQVEEPKTEKPKKDNAPRVKDRKKLSYKLKLELESLPAQIEAYEEEIAELEQAISDPGFYSQDQEVTTKVLTHLAQTQSKLETAYDRWQELDELADS